MRQSIVLWIIMIILLVACSERHLIKNKKYREQVHQEFEKQKELFAEKNDRTFSIVDDATSLEEKEALEFLFAYMPLNDLVDYNGDFFYTQVKTALKARNEMPWGRSIPDEIFYHFVLPYRVSNENLDTFRIAVYDELKQRVRGMNMKEAALEINHWCHEKVTYRATDSRTVAPLSLMRTSWGRCGEEAVFTVNSMRAVGIPARQCYTPRWAHTDDNHAWVEVWIQGEWYFLGACEPEPELNMGWFAEPVTRAMLVSSVIYGDYSGNETVDSRNEKNTTLNVTGNYAPVKKVMVKVLNKEGQPVEDAKVYFKLFNYGELSTIALKKTNNNGLLSMTSGLGDYIVWATDSSSFGFKKVTVEQTDTVEIVLSDTPQTIKSVQFDIVPPINHTPRKTDARHRDENKQRLKREDEIRNAYIASFPDSSTAADYAKKMDLPPEQVWRAIHRSAGNWKEILLFMETAIQFNKEEALDLLEVISDKDVQDTPAEILLDHFKNAGNVKQDWKKDYYRDYLDYVLNPRIANEILVPYRSFIQQSFTENQKILFQADPTSLFHWTKEKIQLMENEDFSRIVISPIGVMKARMADLYSMNVFFIAACRSLGIPARINNKSHSPEYFVRGEWRCVQFKEAKDTIVPKGYLHIDAGETDFDPVYYKHWTLARYNNGIYQTVGLEWDSKLSSVGDKIELNIGDYMLVTGIRKNNGTVPCQLEFFQIHKNETTRLKPVFRDSEEELKVLGEVNLKNKISVYDSGEIFSIQELLGGHEGILVWIDPDKEPTKHVIGDLIRLKDKFEDWNGKVVLLLDQESISQTFDPSVFSGIPSNCIYAFDLKMELIKSIEKENHKLILSQYPIVLVVDANGKYYYYSNGYKIGVGEQLIKTLKKLSAE